MKKMLRKAHNVHRSRVSWFESACISAGLSHQDIIAVLQESKRRIKKLNKKSDVITGACLESGDFDREDLVNDYGALAFRLEACRYSPCLSNACPKCATLKSLILADRFWPDIPGVPAAVASGGYGQHTIEQPSLKHILELDKTELELVIPGYAFSAILANFRS